ncbi:hypothetical protein COOONC_17900, partial [Cooperia oncophora]
LQPYSNAISAVKSACFKYDDLVWRDPNALTRRIFPDNGLTLWGDPEIANARPIRRWLVNEGEDESIEEALARNPRLESDEEDASKFESGDTSNRWPFPFPRPTAKGIVTGWIEITPKEGQDGISSFPQVSNAEAVLSSTPVRSTEFGTSANIDSYTYELPGLQDKPQFTVSRFINRLRSDASELQAIAMDLQHVISQIKDGSISNEQIERYMFQFEEVLIILSTNKLHF